MTQNELIAKKAYYEAKKVELSLDSHETEIKEKVDAFRNEKQQEILDYEAKLTLEFAAQKEADTKKVDHYLELLDELIEEANAKVNAQEPIIEEEQSNEASSLT